MVSIIICFYERLEHLKRCLNSLKFSSRDFDEVIITDDGSSQDTVTKLQQLISEYDFPVKHVWQPHKNFQVAAARNNGIRNSKGDYLIFFDCDFLILKDTIQQHLDKAKPGRFVAGHCKYLDRHQTERLFRTPFSLEELAVLYQSTSDKELRKSHRRFIKRTILMRLGLVPSTKQSLGGHLSIHRKDIEAVNGYDENYVGWGGEDEDLGIRLVAAGIFGCSAIPYARVLHAWHKKELGNQPWTKGSNVEYFKRKNRPTFCTNGLHKPH